MKKLDYIDGIKGAGAFIVFCCHFVFAFYYAAYSLDPACAHTGGVEIFIGKTPLNLLYSGNSAVCVFLTVSGFLLCLSYFRTGDGQKLKKGAQKRYFRLMPMVLAVNVLIFILMSLGLYQNDTVSGITLSTEWFALFNQFDPDVSSLLFESLIGCFITGSNDYNGVLWTMPYLFLGALAVYALAYFLGDKRFRYVVYAALVMAALKTDVYYAPVLLGFWACDVFCTQERLIEAWRGFRPLPVLSFAAGIYLLSYPSIGVDLPGTIYFLPAAYTTIWHVGGAALMLCGVLGSKALQRFFGSGPLKKLGDVSYTLYLIHFPVIATFSCAFFLAAYESLGYNLTVLLDFVVTFFVVIVLSVIGRRYLEPVSKKIIDGLERTGGASGR